MTGLTVRAKVVDLRADTPSESDRLWVDTQVWIVLCYDRASCPPNLREYPRYVKRATEAKAAFAAGTIHLAELAKHIEHQERQIHQQTNGLRDMSVKSFRTISAARADTVTRISSSWHMLMSMANLASQAVTTDHVEATIHTLEAGALLDPGDALQLAEASASGIDLILSDDADFATVPGITLLTANERVLRAAADQGRAVRDRR